MLRKHGLSLAMLLSFSCAASVSQAAPAANIVFILADDLGWADTTLFGNTRYYQTPNLERLARRGMTFSNAYSASPLCSPTRASILTGLHPARIGITAPECHLPEERLEADPGKQGPPDCKSTVCKSATRLKTEYVTLAETLKSAGYATGHFGKWHLGPEPFSPLQQGFDVDVPHYPGPGPAGSYVAPWKFKDFKEASPGEHIEDRMAREAVAFLETNRNHPFFLNYWMFSVHAPFDAKASVIEKYKPLADPANPQRSPTYAAMVASLDDAVGTLLDTLDRLQLTERTIIVFFSDNGGNMYNEVDGTTPTSNAPLRGGKGNVFEGGVRVPCIVCWPGHVSGGTRSDAVIQSCDFYPTLLQMLDMRPTQGQKFDGISIVPALHGQALTRDAIFTYFPHQSKVPDWLPPAVSVRCGDWKLIRIFYGGENGAHRWKLFNLANDLAEKNDLAEAQPQRVHELEAKIEAFLRDTHAVLPQPNPAFDAKSYHPELEGVPPPKRPPGQPKPGPIWKARNCSATLTNGVATIRQTGPSPFIGLAAGRDQGPATLRLRIRAEKDGAVTVRGLARGGAAEHPASVSIPFKGGAWRTLETELPAGFPLNILRLYLPDNGVPVEIDVITLLPRQKAPERWSF